MTPFDFVMSVAGGLSFDFFVSNRLELHPGGVTTVWSLGGARVGMSSTALLVFRGVVVLLTVLSVHMFALKCLLWNLIFHRRDRILRGILGLAV